MGLNLDPELIRQLLQVFRTELEEKLQSLTGGLLALEKGISGAEYAACLDSLFRDAHNIKGAAQGVDVQNVASIAHSLETLFGTLRQCPSGINSSTIDLCLLSLDHMRAAMQCYDAQQDLSFDLPAFLVQLGKGAVLSSLVDSPEVSTIPPTSGVVHQDKEATRVTLDKLDRISALVEDLLSTKIQMQDHVDSLQMLDKKLHGISERWSKASLSLTQGADELSGAPNWRSLIKELDGISLLSTNSQQICKQLRATNLTITHVSETLQDQVRMMRLVPVATLLRPMARLVRDIAHELGKIVDYQVVGDDIEIDRPILEGLKDPLVHLLRNAIDHGIESPVERRELGKPEKGSLRVTVLSLGNRIDLTIQDGSGISATNLLAMAIKKKILSTAEAELMSAEEAINLIFRAGFSTKEIITNVSGRGVGLDVVASRVAAMKGSVMVSAQEGKGTTFKLSFPLSLSTDRGLMVSAGDTEYTISTSFVSRVMEINASELVDIQGGKAVMYQGKAIPAFELASLLETEGSKFNVKTQLSVVIITKDWKSIALMVDEIIGEREIVIKSLQLPLVSVRNVSGGSLTGSGKVMVVLNPSDLIHSAMHQSASVRTHEKTEDPERVNIKRILIVDDSITTRTLEKNILEAHGYEVDVAVDGKHAWDALNQAMYDLIVTDIEMPEMSGFELTERIKSSEAYHQIPVVIVTSLAKETDRRQGISVGADAYIVKGQFETKALLDVIKQLI